jgi:DNA-binding response OmpR family regulator
MKKYAKIISNDSRFSRMLTLRLSDIGVDVLDELSLDVPDSRNFFIADLDSCSEKELECYFNKTTVIGFSNSYEDELEGKIAFCHHFYHRPFLISDFLDVFEADVEPIPKQRKPKQNPQTKNLNYLTVDNSTKAALWGNMRIPLSENEYKLLSVLCENRGETVSREEIYSILGAEDGNMGDVYICHLRRKIDNKLGLKLIYTIRGKGYMLKN